MRLILKYSLLNSASGLLTGFLVWFSATGEGYYFFPVAAPVAAFITGWIFWEIFQGNQKKLKISKALLAGLFAGSVSHYLCWLIIVIGMNIRHVFHGNAAESLFTIVTGCFALTFFSLMFYGWLTVPMAVIIGVFLVKKENKKRVGEQ